MPPPSERSILHARADDTYRDWDEMVDGPDRHWFRPDLFFSDAQLSAWQAGCKRKGEARKRFLFAGALGAHRFYLGHRRAGVALLTITAALAFYYLVVDRRTTALHGWAGAFAGWYAAWLVFEFLSIPRHVTAFNEGLAYRVGTSVPY